MLAPIRVRHLSDTISQAVQHRRSKAEQKQVPIPHHIEFVNQYVHRATAKGWEEHLLPQNILGTAY